VWEARSKKGATVSNTMKRSHSCLAAAALCAALLWSASAPAAEAQSDVPPEANPNAVNTLSGKEVPSEGKGVREEVDEGLEKARETGETLRDKAGNVGEEIRKGAKDVGEEVRKGAKAAKEFASDAWISAKVKAAL